jgi:hypothetical protein
MPLDSMASRSALVVNQRRDVFTPAAESSTVSSGPSTAASQTPVGKNVGSLGEPGRIRTVEVPQRDAGWHVFWDRCPRSPWWQLVGNRCCRCW